MVEISSRWVTPILVVITALLFIFAYLFMLAGETMAWLILLFFGILMALISVVAIGSVKKKD